VREAHQHSTGPVFRDNPPNSRRADPMCRCSAQVARRSGVLAHERLRPQPNTDQLQLRERSQAPARMPRTVPHAESVPLAQS
jgi:hypothetical protein